AAARACRAARDDDRAKEGGRGLIPRQRDRECRSPGCERPPAAVERLLVAKRDLRRRIARDHLSHLVVDLRVVVHLLLKLGILFADVATEAASVVTQFGVELGGRSHWYLRLG